MLGHVEASKQAARTHHVVQLSDLRMRLFEGSDSQKPLPKKNEPNGKKECS
jgi:hypothetical protein